MKRTDKEKIAIELFAKANPNSIVSDLLMNFDRDTVLTFIELYGGRRFVVPRTRNIWISYRNRKIKELLDEKNSRENRYILAENFGITATRVSRIYSIGSGEEHVIIKDRAIKDIVFVIFKKNLRFFYKEMRKLSGLKGRIGLLYDEMQNPEFLFFVKENKQRFIEKCTEDINDHLVFSGRDHCKERAISLLLKKTENEL